MLAFKLDRSFQIRNYFIKITWLAAMNLRISLCGTRIHRYLHPCHLAQRPLNEVIINHCSIRGNAKIKSGFMASVNSLNNLFVQQRLTFTRKMNTLDSEGTHLTQQIHHRISIHRTRFVTDIIVGTKDTAMIAGAHR